MAGVSMEQAKAAVSWRSTRFRPRDRFNVVEFNSIMRPLFATRCPQRPRTCSTRRHWVKALRATGGTEMAPALSFALNGRETPGYLRQVIFMTDGGVSNEDELFSSSPQRLGSSRLFTVGIGSAPNSHFMTKAAQFGRGSLHLHRRRARGAGKMSTLFAKIECAGAEGRRDPLGRRRARRDLPAARSRPLPRRADRGVGRGQPKQLAHDRRVGLRGNQPWSVALTPSSDSDAGGVGASGPGEDSRRSWTRCAPAASRRDPRAGR
jgi:Ca-activated chloride channel family protein